MGNYKIVFLLNILKTDLTKSMFFSSSTPHLFIIHSSNNYKTQNESFQTKI